MKWRALELFQLHIKVIQYLTAQFIDDDEQNCCSVTALGLGVKKGLRIKLVINKVTISSAHYMLPLQ